MVVEFSGKVAVKIVVLGLVFSGSKPLNPKRTPPFSLLSSTAVPDLLTSSMLALRISAPVYTYLSCHFNFPQMPRSFFLVPGIQTTRILTNKSGLESFTVLKRRFSLLTT